MSADDYGTATTEKKIIVKEDGSPITDKQKSYLISMGEQLARYIIVFPEVMAEIDDDLVSEAEIIVEDIRALLDLGLTKAQGSMIISDLKPYLATLKLRIARARSARTTRLSVVSSPHMHEWKLESEEPAPVLTHPADDIPF